MKKLVLLALFMSPLIILPADAPVEAAVLARPDYLGRLMAQVAAARQQGYAVVQRHTTTAKDTIARQAVALKNYAVAQWNGISPETIRTVEKEAVLNNDIVLGILFILYTRLMTDSTFGYLTTIQLAGTYSYLWRQLLPLIKDKNNFTPTNSRKLHGLVQRLQPKLDMIAAGTLVTGFGFFGVQGLATTALGLLLAKSQYPTEAEVESALARGDMIREADGTLKGAATLKYLEPVTDFINAPAVVPPAAPAVVAPAPGSSKLVPTLMGVGGVAVIGAGLYYLYQQYTKNQKQQAVSQPEDSDNANLPDWAKTT